MMERPGTSQADARVSDIMMWSMRELVDPELYEERSPRVPFQVLM
jgi:hypothetical protein